MEMLKEIGKDEVVHISGHDLANIDDMGTIQRDLSNMQNNIDNVQSHDTAEPTIHTMQVMDEMDLAGGEQVVSQEEIGQQDTEIQVTGIDCLDGDTVRMVDEHIREVIEKIYIYLQIEQINDLYVYSDRCISILI